jgi:hypothetical protein
MAAIGISKTSATGILIEQAVYDGHWGRLLP